MNTEHSASAGPWSEAEILVPSDENAALKSGAAPSHAPVIGVVAMMAVALPLVFALRSNPQAAQSLGRSDSPVSATAILWNSNLENACQIAMASGKTMMLWFVRDACPSCDLMERETLGRAPIIAEAQFFVPLKIDVALQPQLAARYRVETCPTIVWADAAGNEKHRAEGVLNGFELYQAMQQFH